MPRFITKPRRARSSRRAFGSSEQDAFMAFDPFGASCKDVATMIGVVVVTHGQLAIELVNAAEMIVGDLPQFTAVSIGWHDDVNDARGEIEQAIERVRA